MRGLTCFYRRSFWGVTLVALGALAWGAPEAAAEPEEPRRLEPRMPDLSGVVIDEEWALILGKALFWDEAVGSDGVACASCHYHAGADSRITNGLSPGMLELPTADHGFGALGPSGMEGLTASGGVAGANYTVVPDDFPFHQVDDPLDRNSDIIVTTNDRFSSAGTFGGVYSDWPRLPGFPNGGGHDPCEPGDLSVFHVNGLATRKVEPRHTPTTINAVFNHRNFWDGRASNSFNGLNPFGTAAHVDPTAGVIVHQGAGPGPHFIQGFLRELGFSWTVTPSQPPFILEYLDIPDASLASQASGPPLSGTEMSCEGRTFPDLGRRMLRYHQRPLKNQNIHPDDSVFGWMGPKGDVRGAQGLAFTYRELIRKSFHPKYWSGPPHNLVKKSDGTVTVGPGYTQMEHNFSMFFGIAVMLYEATLISDQSRFDSALPCIEDPLCDPVAEGWLSELEMDGFELFGSGFAGGGPGAIGGRCVACHGGDLFTAAASALHEDPVRLIGRSFEEDGFGGLRATLFDEGYFNIGVRPVHEDPGLGGFDDYGNPLSLARRYKGWRYFDRDPEYYTGFTFDPCDLQRDFEEPFDPDDCGYEPTGPVVGDEAVKVDGAFKTPTLRNVALTPPYFHYGGYKDLREVMEFYAHGGNRRDRSLVDLSWGGDDSGTGPLGEGPLPYTGPDSWTNVEDNVVELDLALGGGKDQQYGIDALIAFMKTLTDRRVQCDAAPFDHPSLRLFVGHHPYDLDGDGRADDIVVVLPEVGAEGYDPNTGLCIPNTGDLFSPGMQARVGGAPSDPAEFLEVEPPEPGPYGGYAPKHRQRATDRAEARETWSEGFAE